MVHGFLGNTLSRFSGGGLLRLGPIGALGGFPVQLAALIAPRGPVYFESGRL